jgi:hypothetical protein
MKVVAQMMGIIEKQGRVEALSFSSVKTCPNFHKAGSSAVEDFFHF